MRTLSSLVRTCEACPAQWEGKTNDGLAVYIHFRWGTLTVRMGDSINEALNNAPCFEIRVDPEGWNGEMSYETLCQHLAGLFEMPLREGALPWP